MPRFGGPSTMMRLPSQTDSSNLDVCFVGVLLYIGASNCSGTRYGARAIRSESSLIRPYNMGTKAAPFDSLRVADIGDVALNTFDLKKSIDIIERSYDEILINPCKPLTLGGDHTITLPILRAIAKKKHGSDGLIHVDAHSDINDEMFGEKIAHGTVFKRAAEEGLLDSKRVIQIGMRGSGYAAEDFDWSREQGFRVVQIEECWHKSLAPLMAEVRDQLSGGSVYFRACPRIDSFTVKH